MQSQVVVIGAGLAGLYACRLLQAADVDFVLLEARDRIGGRILSVDEAGRPSDDGVDLGPSWYWPRMQPGLAKLVEELGLSAFGQNSEGDVIFERMSREPAQRCRAVVESRYSMRLAGGSASLTRALARGLPWDRVMLNARVTEMALGDNAVEVTFARTDGGMEKASAAHVIAALPPRLIETNISFTPSLDEAVARRWRATPTWMAPHAKFFALYDRPFWRDAGLSGTAQSMVGPMLEMHDATTASGAAALFGFVGVAAEQRAALGETTLKRMCLDQFVRIFGAEARTPRAALLKDWAADALTATPADRGAGGFIAADDTPWVTAAWADRLALAGSETSLVEPGYLAGAVEAGKRAVGETLRKIKNAVV